MDTNLRSITNLGIRGSGYGQRRSTRRKRGRGEKQFVVSSDTLLRDLKVQVMQILIEKTIIQIMSVCKDLKNGWIYCVVLLRSCHLLCIWLLLSLSPYFLTSSLFTFSLPLSLYLLILMQPREGGYIGLFITLVPKFL